MCCMPQRPKSSQPAAAELSSAGDQEQGLDDEQGMLGAEPSSLWEGAEAGQKKKISSALDMAQPFQVLAML